MGRKSGGYLKGRKCCRCDADLSIEKHHGYREYNDKGQWTGKWLCQSCWDLYSSESTHNAIKFVTNCRNDQIGKYKTQGKGIIGEAVIAKVRKLDIISIQMDNFRFKFDLSIDQQYKRIQAKFRIPLYGECNVVFGDDHNFDTLFVLYTSKGMKDIERVYAIPEKELYDKKGIRIVNNDSIRGSKWENFRVDNEPYNAVYHSLMEFIKDKKYFGIEDIKKWLEGEI